MSSPIRTQNLAKKFGRVEALRGVDLEVPQGAIYALVGPNGAGKTTAIKILMNILRPSTGRAEVLEKDSRKITGEAFSSIGYVSENQELPGWMKVDAFFEYLRPFYPTWDRQLESDLVRQFDLPLDRRLKTLSRGMRMKAALASSLAYHPKLIVLDEPFSGLDPLVREELVQALLERAEESTVFISSHDLAEIESFATHVGYLEKGQLRFSEEMTSLSERFREVELTLVEPATARQAWPATWIGVEMAGVVARFIDTQFHAQRSTETIRETFGQVRSTTFTPMSLRSIFLATARDGRKVSPERVNS